MHKRQVLLREATEMISIIFRRTNHAYNSHRRDTMRRDKTVLSHHVGRCEVAISHTREMFVQHRKKAENSEAKTASKQ